MTTRLRCACCGFEQDYDDLEQAFEDGWDAPPHFSYVGCPICPGVCAALGVGHEKAHAYWAEHGRPADFHPTTCCADPDWDKYHGAH